MNTETPVKKTRGNLPPGPGPGRPKGVSNKNTKVLKDMILEALEGAGGVKYLMAQASENPKAFMTLVGRVLPLQVTGANGGPIETTSSLNVSGLSTEALAEIMKASDAAKSS
jgi:hypothetical protein